MKRYTLMFVLLMLTTIPFFAQAKKDWTKDETEQIKALVLKTFAAMKSVDTLALKACFTPTAILQITSPKPEGTVVREIPAAKFIHNVGLRKPGEMDERVVSWGPILIDHEIATAWVPYTFHLNGVFSHKGVDVFLLVKVGYEFKIHTLMYNMQKE